MASPPQQIYSDRYEPVRLVARGGMAEVWEARDGLLDRTVALKVLFPELSIDPNFVERFRREAQAAANLSHPNIVSVYDWGEAGGTYFIVMEYVQGQPLSALLRERGPLLADRAATIGADVAAALGFAHRNGVIHRDVKPGNVLITNDDHVKVTDFGIARAANTDDHLTQTGAVMGTATYFSPEQAQGLAVDQRSDVYSLGIVLYEMVTGRPPFVAESPVATAYKHVHEQPQPPSGLTPELPRSFEAIVLQALAKDVNDRYATVEELRADLLRFRQGRPVLAEPPLLTPKGGGAAGGASVAAGGASVAAGGASVAAGGAAGAAGVAGAVAGAAAGAGAGVAAAAADGIGRRSGGAATGGIAAAGDGAGASGGGALAAGAAGASGVTGAAARPAARSAPTSGPPVGPSVEPEDGVRSLWVYGILLAVLLTALIVVVVLLVRQLDLFGTSNASAKSSTPVAIPADLVGKTYDSAANELRQLGIGGVSRKDVSDVTHPADTVIASIPAAGQSVSLSGTVELDVASGPSSVTEPDVVGATFADASQQLQARGYKVAGPVSKDSDTIAAGQVISQDPPQGTQGHQGDTVTLTVSDGRGGALVPDETGKDATVAANDLQTAGLSSYTAGHDTSPTVPAGSVIRTNPPAGTAVPKGTRVGLTISSGPAKARVPYVKGYTEAYAKSAIEGRGLVVTETTQTVTDSSQNGLVIDQNPAGGTQVDQGSSVNIVIGQYTAPATTTTSPPLGL